MFSCLIDTLNKMQWSDWFLFVPMVVFVLQGLRSRADLLKMMMIMMGCVATLFIAVPGVVLGMVSAGDDAGVRV